MEKLITIRTIKELEDLMSYLQDKDFVAFDTETDGVDKESCIIGMSVSAEANIGYYIVLASWDVEANILVFSDICKASPDFFKLLQTKKLLMHNAVFDCFMVNNNFGVDLMPSVHTDTMLLAHVVNENRRCGLKELGATIFGTDATKEQKDMKDSVIANGGKLTKDCYELFKADTDLMAKYGAKDAILTYNLFYILVEELYEQGLDGFFYNEESMPLLRGPTYDLNTVGLRVDPERLQRLRGALEVEIEEGKAFIQKEIHDFIKDEYPGTSPTKTFNIGSNRHLAWLLFNKLGNKFNTLTKEGKELCRFLDMERLPYSDGDKAIFCERARKRKGEVWKRVGKTQRPTKIGDFWNYTGCGKETLKLLEDKYRWVKALLTYKKNVKILTTYVIGIHQRQKYNIVRPSFFQHGTSSGRYSSKNPNFQNLPRDDKRVKSCIVSRPGKVFVGADYSQLEPRVFASLSGDKRLIECFTSGDDFYSVIAQEVFGLYDCHTKKDDSPNSLALKHSKERQIAKTIALAVTYGTTPPKLALITGKSRAEAYEIVENYFSSFPSVEKMMLDSHKRAKEDGQVLSMFGRPRRLPTAKEIYAVYRDTPHADLPYHIRNILNLAVNHRMQSTAASIVNRAAVSVWKTCKELSVSDSKWLEVKIVLQVHDELILEGPEELASAMIRVLKDAMENTVSLPGVDLIAEPKVAKDLGSLK